MSRNKNLGPLGRAGGAGRASPGSRQKPLAPSWEWEQKWRAWETQLASALAGQGLGYAGHSFQPAGTLGSEGNKDPQTEVTHVCKEKMAD